MTSALAADLSRTFEAFYSAGKDLSEEERKIFAKLDFYLVPGILSETFIDDDQRSDIDFSFLTGNYFEGQYKTLHKKYSFATERLSPSSLSVDETKANIRASLEKSRSRGRKAFFICHSLGGVSLLEELIEKKSAQNDVAGIIFLQSPFSGTPVADTFINNTDSDGKTLGFFLAWLNLSHQTVEFLSTPHRLRYMDEKKQAIEQLVSRIPVITLGGIANGHLTLFAPSLPLIKEDSDGMVPFKSSRLLEADFIKLDKADHGELVVRIPFGNFSKERFTEALLKLISNRIK